MEKKLITEVETKRMAKLARINIKDQSEAEYYTAQLNRILGMMEKISTVNTEGVPRTVNVTDAPIPMREDIVVEGDDVLSNAPESLYGYFVVPKVIE